MTSKNKSPHLPAGILGRCGDKLAMAYFAPRFETRSSRQRGTSLYVATEKAKSVMGHGDKETPIFLDRRRGCRIKNGLK